MRVMRFGEQNVPRTLLFHLCQNRRVVAPVYGQAVVTLLTLSRFSMSTCAMNILVVKQLTTCALNVVGTIAVPKQLNVTISPVIYLSTFH